MTILEDYRYHMRQARRFARLAKAEILAGYVPTYYRKCAYQHLKFALFII